jgi:hypothetical protein
VSPRGPSVYSPVVSREGWYSFAPPPHEFTVCPICGETVKEERDENGWALWCDLSVQYDEIEHWTAHVACVRSAFPHARELPFHAQEHESR